MLSLLDLLNGKRYKFSNIFMNKLTYAILLHDTGKLFESQFKDRYYFPIYHAYLSRSIASHEFGIDDEGILNAILFHPTGRADMTMLEIFLYLIDFSELNRKFPEAQMCRGLIMEGNIYDALVYTGKTKISYIEKQGQPLNLNTVKMVNYYEKMA